MVENFKFKIIGEPVIPNKEFIELIHHTLIEVVSSQSPFEPGVLDSDKQPSTDTKFFKFKRGNYSGHYIEIGQATIPHGVGMYSDVDKVIVGHYVLGR